MVTDEPKEEQGLAEPDASDPDAIKKYMCYFFRSKGLSREAVAGIVGNVQSECSFDLAKAKEINPNRFGLFQWGNSDGRLQAFNKWAEENERDINLISTQCDYAYEEMKNGGMLSIILDVNENNSSKLMCNYTALENAKSPEEAAKIFATSFERCYTSYHIDSDGQMYYDNIQASSERQKNAGDIYKDIIKLEENGWE